MSRAIIHLDMDAFYASVEQRDEPALKGRPVIVGGHPTRGVVLAASYEVRPLGVRSAMPMARALMLAPKAIVRPPRPHAYAEASQAVFRIFARYTPLIEPLSLDEAFLDVTASSALFGAAADIAARIRHEINAELQLPCSAGIAEVKFVAKIASDLAKPAGQREVKPGQAKAFLAPLPVSRLWGVGPHTEQRFKGLGLHTIGQVAERPAAWLVNHLGPQGHHFWELANAIDERSVVPDREAKSMGAQDTFESDLLGEEAILPHLHAQALRVAFRLRQAQIRTRAVVLTVKYGDFTTVTRRRTLASPSDDGQRLYREAEHLLREVDLTRPIRLTGVAAHHLDAPEVQLGLFAAETAAPRVDKLNRALDAIASRFGKGAITTADLSTEESPVRR